MFKVVKFVESFGAKDKKALYYHLLLLCAFLQSYCEIPFCFGEFGIEAEDKKNSSSLSSLFLASVCEEMSMSGNFPLLILILKFVHNSKTRNSLAITISK